MFNKTMGAAFASALILFAGSAFAQPFVNPIDGPCVAGGSADFDSAPPGWTPLNTPDCYPSGHSSFSTVIATEGDTFMRFAAPNTNKINETMMTTIEGLTPGEECTMMFDARPSTSTAMANFAWRIDGGAPFAVIPVAGTAWTTVSFSFPATAATQFLEIGGNDNGETGSRSILIDNVRISCVGEEPTSVLEPASELQALAAARAQRSINDHIAYRLGLSGQQQDPYLLQYTFEDEDRDFANGGRWTAASVELGELGGTVAGDNVFASFIAGWDRNETEESLWGITLGAEYGSYDYVGNGSLEKLGLSAGIYGGRRLGERGLVEGYLTGTYFFNRLADATGNTADLSSLRAMANVSLSAKLGTSGGLTVVPYLEATYAIEMFEDHTLGANTFTGTTAEVGMASLGLEITTPWNEKYGQFFLRVSGDQTFGSEPVTLSSGAVLTPYEDVTGTVGLGWITNTGYDSIGKIEASVSNIGNDDAQEARVSGHWERNF